MQNILCQRNEIENVGNKHAGNIDLETTDVGNTDRENAGLYPVNVKITGIKMADMRTANEETAGLGKTGVKSVDTKDSILIHDAASPLLTQRQLQDCFAMLSGHDGVMPTLLIRDTVYLSRDGSRVSELIERKQLYAGLAPEVFNFRKYYLANMSLMLDRLTFINGSTEPAVMVGMDIVMIPGEEMNFKITTPGDIYRFQILVEEGCMSSLGKLVKKWKNILLYNGCEEVEKKTVILALLWVCGCSGRESDVAAQQYFI